MDELRKQLLDSMFNQLQQGMSEMSPEQLQRMKDMLAELNHMLEQRERGEEPDFEGFMDRYGDFFPEQPADARRAARADGALDGADAAAAQLDDARAARAAAGARELAARRHGSALAGRPARPEPAQRVPADGLGPADAVPRRRADAARPDEQRARPARRHRRARAHAAQRDEPRPARRGRPRPGARAARRRRGPFARPARASSPRSSRRPA